MESSSQIYHNEEWHHIYGRRPTADGRRLRIDRFDRIDRTGRVTLRYAGKLHHIGIGNAYARWRVAMLSEDRNIEIVALDGSPLRRLVLDPTKDYRRIP